MEKGGAMRKRAVIAAGIAVLVAGTVFVTLAHGATQAPNAVDPSNFVAHVTNPYFPLKPGTVLIYKGMKDGQQQTDRVEVTHRTKTIEGVKATVVHDVATHEGNVLEATFDYYAQDKAGTVWYFGEDTKAFENGHVSTEGSWLAGRNNARPGIIMEADPHVSNGYRQEFLKGHAEDQAWIVATRATFHVGYGTFSPAIKSFEWSRLEPNVIDEKDYGRGVGIIREISRTGAIETSFLVHVHRP
jgi:hypothetical protein